MQLEFCGRPLVWLGLLFPLTASALDHDLLNAVQAGAGIYSSIFIHELGHALAATAVGGQDVSIEVPDSKGGILSGRTRWKMDKAFSPAEWKIVSVSGLAAANLAGEVILAHRNMRGAAYGQSILGTAVVSNAANVYRYYTKIRGKDGYEGNDIDQFELAGGNPHLLSAALLGYSAWTLHRMRQRDVPLFFVNLKF
jgi:hypothetical protein